MNQALHGHEISLAKERRDVSTRRQRVERRNASNGQKIDA
jgi:hypothetical protein